MSENISFSRYGKAFQEGLVQIIYEDRPFADQITEVLDTNFLELEYLRVFVEKIINYRDRYGTHPSAEAVITMLRTELDSEDEIVRKQVREYFAKITAKEATDTQYIKEQSLDFCRKQALKEALEESVRAIASEQYESVIDIMKDAISKGSPSSIGHDFFNDYDYNDHLQVIYLYDLAY